ncbi:hypothetical protein ABZY93_15155 [Streptomyces smyrnaeus]|uniref:hypothetical protein n=1 Tax=Streptomyces smyrnaeus TaxID=1387713 RepID=UPI0033A905CE
MKLQLCIRMKGNLGEQLSEFREQVGLTRRGRLDDVFDQEFGRRELRPKAQGKVELTLWRGFEDHDWMIEITYERDPLPSDEAERIRRNILNAAAKTGMTVTTQFPSQISQ